MRKKTIICNSLILMSLLILPVGISVPLITSNQVESTKKNKLVKHNDEYLKQENDSTNENQYWYIGVIIASVVLLIIIILLIWRIYKQISDKKIREKKKKSVPIKELYDPDYYCKNRINDDDDLVRGQYE